VRLTVLGSSASQPAAGDASSGYLIAEGASTLLVDCGSGVLGNLQQHASLDALDAIVISHMHADHYIDLIAMRYGRRYGAPGQREIAVYLPPGGAAKLQAVSEAISSTQPFFAGALSLRDYAPGERIDVGELTVEPREVVHGIRSFGMLIVGRGGATLAYSSDTVCCDEIVELARDADVLLAENTLGGGAPSHHQPVTHISAEEAGQLAARARAGRLVLTHFWHTADRELARAEAARHFEGEVLAARPHLSVEIG